jgi:hypothetical protein
VVGARTIDTGIVDLLTDDASNDVVTPLTGAVRAIEMKDVQLDVWILARTMAQVRIGVEYSNNPVDFYSGVSRKELFAGYLTTAGWNYGTAWYDLFNVTGLADADYKLYTRLVGLAKTTMSSTKAEGMQLRALIRQKPIRPQTLASPFVRVNTKGSTSVSNFTPITGPMSTDGVAIHRVTTEVAANSGCSLTVEWQQTDTPDDVTSWATGGTVGSSITGTGMTYPGKPVSVSPSKRSMRYGVQSLNVSGTEIESAIVRFVIDQRDR